MKGFNKCCISSAGDKAEGDMLWNGSEGDGDIRSEHEEDEGMTSKTETATLSGKRTRRVRKVKIYHV